MEESGREGGHVICLPFPAQGHINPMIQFSKRLASKGMMKVTFISISDKPSSPYRTQHDITVITISNGFEEGEKPRDLDEIVDRVQRSVTKRLPQLIKELSRSEFPPRALVYDSAIPWALDIARSSGLYGAVFFTQAWFVNVIYYHAMNGDFCLTSGGAECMDLTPFPSLSKLCRSDLPSLVSDPSSYPAIFRVQVNQFSNIEQADMVLCNTFDALEEKARTIT